MISIIVPTLNEAANLRRLLPTLAAQAVMHEILVVDGGSADETQAVARASGARVLEVRPSRGGQIAAGAAAARGDVLWFLHADSDVPQGAMTALVQTLAADPAVPGGNFRLLFDGMRPFDGRFCLRASARTGRAYMLHRRAAFAYVLAPLCRSLEVLDRRGLACHPCALRAGARCADACAPLPVQ
jgi:glycosyltransferase involved in cell wall biosynthesis